MSAKKKSKRKMAAVFLGDEIAEYLGTLPPPKLDLLFCWQKVAAPHLLAHSNNVVFSPQSEETEILVYVDSAAYAAELSMEKEFYRLRMQQETNKEIADIKFLVSRKSVWRKGR